VLELLGGEGVTDRNLMQYLGVLEQRTNELLTSYFVLAADGSEEAAAERAAAVLSGRHAGAQAPLQYVIDPPSAGGMLPPAAAGCRVVPRGDKDGAAGAAGPEDERPLSRASLAARARRAVAGKAEAVIKIKAVRVQESSTGSVSRR
jgi:hypothetical protein